MAATKTSTKKAATKTPTKKASKLSSERKAIRRKSVEKDANNAQDVAPYTWTLYLESSEEPIAVIEKRRAPP